MSEKGGVDIGRRGVGIIVYLFVVASEYIGLRGFVGSDRVASVRMKFTLSKCESLEKMVYRVAETHPSLKELASFHGRSKDADCTTCKSPYITETHLRHVNDHLRDLDRH